MRVRPALASVVLLVLAACTQSWEPQYGPAPQVVAAHAGGAMNVVRKDGTGVLLRNTQVVPDSVVGVGPGGARTAIAFSDIQVISIPRSDSSTGKTLIIVLGATLVALAALGVLWAHEVDSILQ